ncbi:MAG: hypothetical protein H7282_05065 [Cytophagaceae bacterium]|nr:hypothetical protein [Cytophagaceae bacterium]
MGHYKVIALSVGGLGNKIFDYNDFVTSENFHEGRALELVKSGFLKEVTEEEALAGAEDATKDDKQQDEITDLTIDGLSKLKVTELRDLAKSKGYPNPEFATLTKNDLVDYILAKEIPAPLTVKTIDEVSIDYLKDQLTNADVEFAEDATKDDLYTLWTLTV